MMDFFNIHTHIPRHPESEILSQSVDGLLPSGQALYTSVGIHPWFLTEENAEYQWTTLQKQLSHPTVIAIGEGGLDKLKGPSMDFQMDFLKRQIILSEEKELPIVLHCVKAFNELIQLKKEMHPCQPWIIHGFRGKEALAIDCIRHGFYLSFGERFQESALRVVPLERLFIETDDSDTSIESVYQFIAQVRKITLDELKESIKKNVKEVFFKA